MTADRGVPVYLRLAGARTTLDAPTVRLGTAAHLALELAGGRVLRSQEAGVTGKARDDAFWWMLRHDRMLADLTASAVTGGASSTVDPQLGVVVSDEPRTVALAAPVVEGIEDVPVLWAAPAMCLLDPTDVPPAALTLTATDAAVLAGAGIRAVSLLAWPRAAGLPPRVRHVVVAVASAAADRLPAVLDALAAAVPGRPVVDIVADAPLTVAGVRHAPLHPWARSRAVRSCDLVLILGRSAATDLVAFEAAGAGAAVRRVPPARADDPHGWLGATTPVEPSAGADAPHVPVQSLRGWLQTVSRSHGEDGDSHG